METTKPTAARLTEDDYNSNNYARTRCRHIMEDGDRCGSPAMREEKYCYHHHLTRRPVENLRLRRARQSSFSIPMPRTRAEIQEGIGTIMGQLAANDVDPRRAGLLLYALQLAAHNLNQYQALPKATRNNSLTTDNEIAKPVCYPAYPATALPADRPSAVDPTPSSAGHSPSIGHSEANPKNPCISPEAPQPQKEAPTPGDPFMTRSGMGGDRTIPRTPGQLPTQKETPTFTAGTTYPLPIGPIPGDLVEHYGSGPRPQFNPEGGPLGIIKGGYQPPDGDDFRRPQYWLRQRRCIGGGLLEMLARHYGGEELPGSPVDRRTNPGPDPLLSSQ